MLCIESNDSSNNNNNNKNNCKNKTAVTKTITKTTTITETDTAKITTTAATTAATIIPVRKNNQYNDIKQGIPWKPVTLFLSVSLKYSTKGKMSSSLRKRLTKRIVQTMVGSCSLFLHVGLWSNINNNEQPAWDLHRRRWPCYRL